jgi:hypothetical protein
MSHLNLPVLVVYTPVDDVQPADRRGRSDLYRSTHVRCMRLVKSISAFNGKYEGNTHRVFARSTIIGDVASHTRRRDSESGGGIELKDNRAMCTIYTASDVAQEVIREVTR